eukprot:GSChrysophyteH1.ASY1.ANO1.548.1 assembled CDS
MTDFAGDFIDVSGDGGILKKIITEGSGDFPEVGMEVKAHYTGTLQDGTKFDSSRDRGKHFTFPLGTGRVIKGWDQGFASMKKGERAILRCREDYAYGKSGNGKIPPEATLDFDVELISFAPRKKEKHEMSPEEKLAEGSKNKDEGTMLFKEKRFDEAIDCYEEAASYVEDNSESAAADIWLACKLNSAQACLSNKEYPHATNIKGLYRRGVARNHMGLHEEALVDLKAILAVDKENKAAQMEAAKAKKAMAEARRKEKAAFGEKPGSAADNPTVFFDITIGGEPQGRIEMLLYADTTPKTAKNFLQLCTGEAGEKDGAKLHYKGCSFHRVIKGFMIQGGDFTNHNGTGGMSIYGSNQFFITSGPTPHLDGKHVVFGRVVSGLDVFDKVENTPTGPNDKPNQDVLIADCGLVEKKKE